MVRSAILLYIVAAWTLFIPIHSTKLPRFTSQNTMPSRKTSVDGFDNLDGTAGELLQCDYLVVGAGTAGMSFIDTILAENPSATFILVDRNNDPGGHWVHAYPFCKLHQPSCYYGVNSLPLGKIFHKKGRSELYDVRDRATKSEILEYYQAVRQRFEATGRVRCFFGVQYEGLDEERGVHTIVPAWQRPGGDESLGVRCGKVVTVANAITVPSMREPLVHVDESVHFVPVNEVPSSVESGKYKNYVVMGNGKTGADAIVYLLEHEIPQSRITWVISRDVWYMMRDALQDFIGTFEIFDRGMCRTNSVEECFLSFETDGLMGRLDPSLPPPRIFKSPVVSREELDRMRSVETVVREGRVTSVQKGTVVLDRGSLDFSTGDTLLVDCMMEHESAFVDISDDFTIFEPGRITLGPLTSYYNPSGSAARVAFLECALDDDDSKNGCCYFVRGKQYSRPTPEYMVGMTYMEAKSIEALMKVEGGGKFYLNSRTFSESPQHHKFGMIRLLWSMYGPKKLAGFSERFFRKIESKGYSDVDHCWGIETLISQEVET